MQNLENKKTSFQLSPEGVEFVKKELQRYETKLSAVIPCLYRVQSENGGWISPECVSYLSRLMDISESKIFEALTFYTMFNKKPVGRLHIQVCCNVSCAMNGSREIVKNLCQEFKVKQQEMSQDQAVTITPVECLGACDLAPVAQINDRYIGPLKKETVVQKINQLLNNC